MKVSRRDFIGSAALAGAPFFIGCKSAACAAQSPRRIPAGGLVNVACIGCGLIAKHTNVPGFLKDPRCRVTIACDMVEEAPDYFYGARPKGSTKGGWAHLAGSKVVKAMVDKHYGDASCRMVRDWREVVADPSVDAVLIATPDHWHVLIAIAAMRAGKHVYCQKPLTLNISEGKALVKVAKETGVTFQVGNQGRGSADKRIVEEIVLNRLAGDLKRVTVAIPGGDHWEGHGHSEERAPLPKWFTKEAWDLWQGPAEHWENDAYIPCIHDPTCWRWNKRYGGGMIPDFGAHEFDVAQRGMGMDRSGPVAVENMKTDLRKDNGVFSWAGKYDFEFVYASGVRVHVRPVDKAAGVPRGVTFHCEKGDVSTCKGAKRPKGLEKWKESDLKDGDVKLYAPANNHWHEADFIDGILENRPICSDAEIGHRTISCAHIANICEQLRTDRLDWDPAREVFTGRLAAEANAMTEVKYHNGWELKA